MHNETSQENMLPIRERVVSCGEIAWPLREQRSLWTGRPYSGRGAAELRHPTGDGTPVVFFQQFEDHDSRIGVVWPTSLSISAWSHPTGAIVPTNARRRTLRRWAQFVVARLAAASELPDFRHDLRQGYDHHSIRAGIGKVICSTHPNYSEGHERLLALGGVVVPCRFLGPEIFLAPILRGVAEDSSRLFGPDRSADAAVQGLPGRARGIIQEELDSVNIGPRATTRKVLDPEPSMRD